ncbi:hypothetical protein [[Muricauda] lutisoli]|uniref:Lipoprotein n=1 Tax=[Muricauda] lutisoli TaxID=2816035 RepID=A0ABS3ERQ3_9FLAO|nr:hypothetical protein [[Muricauda] lutisoli]MBO0328921.1 hypothetical protein [[Muricauda] lutisoli]
MKRIIFFTVILIMGACKKNTPKGVDRKDGTIDKGNFDQWLSKYNLNTSKFTDTVVNRYFELWAYGDPIKKSDSLLFWYPSKDSTYYLISNYNFDDQTRVDDDWTDIRLRFKARGSDEIKIGMLMLDSLSERKLDIHWRDQSSIYILEELDNGKNFEMMLLSMKSDSIWQYKVN